MAELQLSVDPRQCWLAAPAPNWSPENTEINHMSHFHAVVWIDHKEAKVFTFNADVAEKLVLHAHHPKLAEKHHTDEHFFHAVVEAISQAGEVLITGPSFTKTALMKHIARHDAHLLSRIAGVESADHPTDGQILAHARHYFETHDHKTAQKV